MGSYWIRNRGRVQGPFTVDRLQGLMRRGRFNRHYHVSTDKKDWVPAGDVPELFDAMRSPRGGGDPDESFQSGGSPIDGGFDSDAPAPPVSEGGSPFDDDTPEEEWEDDDSWDAEESGGVLDWIEAHSILLASVLLVAVAGFGWFLYTRDSFVQDLKDLNQLEAVSSQIRRARRSSRDTASWKALGQSISGELAPMIARLESQASAQDHVKQQLLFAARDDIPRIFEREQGAPGQYDNLMRTRLRRVRDLITQQVRIDSQPPVRSTPAAPIDRNPPGDNNRAVDTDSPKAPDNEPGEVNHKADQDTRTDGNPAPGVSPQPGAPSDNAQRPRNQLPEGLRSSADQNRARPGGIPGRRPTTR